jgi:tripartite-type tricarboxylate transporter receptor subunit TctC
MKTNTSVAALALSFAVGLAGSASGQDYDPATYFGGKTIRYVVSWSAGGNGDAYVRIFAPFFEKHVPGNPSFVVENMPGGGHNIATNYMFSQADATGLVIGTYGSARAVASAKGDAGVNFDANAFKYLGSLAGYGAVCMASATTSIKSAADLVNSSEEWIVGDVAPDAAGPTVVKLVGPALGWNARAISAYESDKDVNLAMQRGEVSGSCGPYGGFATDSSWKEKFIPLFTVGLKRDPNLPDVPTVFEIGTLPDETKQVLEAYALRFESSIPLYVPPATPDNVVETLRKAVDETLADPEYRDQSVKAGRSLDGALSGTEVQASVQRIHDVPKEIWAKLSAAQQQ